ncbi:MAG TPA: diacylglycerol kinase family protein [Vicinamibacterales bacterium]
MRVLILHNPKAGDRELDKNDLLTLAREAGHDPVYCSSRSGDWTHLLEVERFDLCVAAGGDGTVSKLGRALAGRGIPLGVLPLGTANNLATALGVAQAAIPELVGSWATAERRGFDVGVATGPWGTRRFLESLGTGLIAEGIAKIDGGHGDGALVEREQDPEAQMAAARQVFERLLASTVSSPMQARVDGRDVTGKYLLLEVMNCPSVGPGLRLAPEASPHDGLLDLVAVGDDQRDILRRQLVGSAPPHALAIGVQQGRSLTLEIFQNVLHVDDWTWHTSNGASRTRIEITIEAGALTVLAPPA